MKHATLVLNIIILNAFSHEIISNPSNKHLNFKGERTVLDRKILLFFMAIELLIMYFENLIRYKL